MCPQKWQRQYDLNDHSILLSTRAHLLVLENIKTNIEVGDKPPSNHKATRADSKRKMESIDCQILKKACKELVHWTDKHCSLCKKHGGMHTMYNTWKCYRYNSYWSPKKSSDSAGPCQKDCNPQDANFKQIIHTDCKKAFCAAFKMAARGKKHCNHCDESDSDSDFDF
jgi:hypothetical protein